ncbi:MAG: DUF3472 domain-containing protein [Ruminococcaceae bacterium]|nr:DUF3472 domain-containing protein [Oscillospiraceae bacterium]
MKKRIFKSILALAILTLMLTSTSVGVFADDVDYMAYNIYLDPDLSKTSRQFDTYTIEFRGVKTPYLTYWALCNFGLGFSEETKAMYPSISGGGAYAGLQNRDEAKGKSSRALIMAFWEMTYLDKNTGEKTILRAARQYPDGEESNFGGEGEGTNHIRPYWWDDDTWYRMYLHCWTDEVTGNTFVGQWFENMSTGEWTIGSVFDTKLKNGWLRGGLSLFQENFVNDYKKERSFNVKNLYAVDHQTKEWVSLATGTLSYGDGGAPNKAGAHTFGATDEYFWGEAGGEVENQVLYEAQSVKSQKYTITQPEKPTFEGTISVKKVGEKVVDTRTKEKVLFWSLDTTSTPQMSYEFTAFDESGKEIYTESANRPYVNTCAFKDIGTEVFTYKLTLTDLFGNKTTTEGASKEYKKLHPEDTTVTDTPASTETAAPTAEPTTTPAGLPTGAIIGIIAGAVVLVGAVIAVVFVAKKKKK